MPKRKRLETVDDLIEELHAAEQTVAAELDQPPQPQLDADRKRGELLKLAEDGELDKSLAYIKKASLKVVEKLHGDYESKRMQKAYEFLTDIFISRFSDVLGGCDAIQDHGSLAKELQRDELLKRDLYSIVESISPYLPYIGVLSGGVIIAKHIYDHRSTPANIPSTQSDNNSVDYLSPPSPATPSFLRVGLCCVV